MRFTVGVATTAGTTSSGRTAWARNLAAPVRDFLSTETGGAAALLTATIAALVWANSPWSDSYESVWTTELSIQLGGTGISHDLRLWVNEGLMTFYFLVVGLEAKRELDQGQLRERRRLAVPVVAALGGMAVPVAIYLAFNAGDRQRPRLGRGDVDRHRVRARRRSRCVAPRGTRLRAAAAHAGGGRRPRGADRDRHGLHGGASPSSRCVVAVALFATLFALRFAPPMWRGRSRRASSAWRSGSRCWSRGSTR